MPAIVSTNKFLRTYLIEIEGKDGATYTIGNSTGNAPLLSLEFSVVRNVLASSQTGVFKIKNLSPEIRNAIYKDYYDQTHFPKIKVQAGYLGSPLSTIFYGIVLEASSFRQEGGVDFITEINAHDFSTFIAPNSYSSITIQKVPGSAGVTRLQIIDQLINDMIKTGETKGLPLTLGIRSPNYLQVSGDAITLDGWSWELLQTYTDKTCFIDNGRIFCIQNNESYDGDVTEISSDTGLLGTPKKFENRLICELIFEPSMKPGQQILLDLTTLGLGGNSNLNSTHNGTYKAVGIQHRGIISSSESAKCITVVELMLTVEQINAAFGQSLPTNGVYGN